MSREGRGIRGDTSPNSLQGNEIELELDNTNVPINGNVYIYFEVDPFDEIKQDGNRSNNQGSLVLFIGALPEVEISFLFRSYDAA